MIIPTFPKSRRLHISDKGYFKNMLKGYPPSADYNFVSLWSYDTEDDVTLSILNNNLIVKFRDYITHEPFYSFFGEKNILDTITALFDYSSRHHVQDSIKLIPEFFLEHHIEQLQFNGFVVEPDRDNFDYIYDLDEVASLAGPMFEKKRYWVHKFSEEHHGYFIKILDLKDKITHQKIFNVFTLWSESKGENPQNVAHDLLVMKRFLASTHFFNCICLAILIDEDIVGFSITEAVSDDFSVCHFVKADRHIKGIFEVIYKNTAVNLRKLNIRYLNRENDLGLEGLRQAKTSWRPIKYIKKYTIKKPREK